MNILILGAAGQISSFLIPTILDEMPEAELKLFARNAHKRLSDANDNVTLVDGDFNETDKLVQSMQGVDVVYLNDMMGTKETESVVSAMERAGVKRLIGATVLGLYDEVGGAFGRWNDRMIGGILQTFKAPAAAVEHSDLDYTLLRLTWLYNQAGNEDYMLTVKGEPFVGAQVTRQAVVRLVMDLLKDNTLYIRASLGASEPDTDWEKPSFY